MKSDSQTRNRAARSVICSILGFKKNGKNDITEGMVQFVRKYRNHWFVLVKHIKHHTTLMLNFKNRSQRTFFVHISFMDRKFTNIGI